MRDLGTTTARQGARAHARAVRAFTLLELLLVISLLAILASITLVVGQGVSERSRIAQARAEMAVLAAALEQYKQHYGDYPWTPEARTSGAPAGPWDGGAILFNALNGNLGPKADTALATKGRTFVDLGRFTLDSADEANLPEVDDPELKQNWFNDPWGNWYYYRYRQGPGDAVWKSKGFLLYSHGPDRACNLGAEDDPSTPVRTGLLEAFPVGAEEINADNLYHGRN